MNTKALGRALFIDVLNISNNGINCKGAWVRNNDDENYIERLLLYVVVPEDPTKLFNQVRADFAHETDVLENWITQGGVAIINGEYWPLGSLLCQNQIG